LALETAVNNEHNIIRKLTILTDPNAAGYVRCPLDKDAACTPHRLRRFRFIAVNSGTFCLLTASEVVRMKTASMGSHSQTQDRKVQRFY
jgi:hypothetical protein